MRLLVDHSQIITRLVAVFFVISFYGSVGLSRAGGVPTVVLDLNLGQDFLFSTAFQDSILFAEIGLPVKERVASWAQRFEAAPGVKYVFGPAEGGYVAEGRLVLDSRQDCVSLVYRCCELGRSSNATGAIGLALETRFAGADLDSLIDKDGRVNYERPEHLDFSLDMIRTGYWGIDVTGEMTGAVADSAGSSRYEPGSFLYVPSGSVARNDLRTGDIVWLVLDAANKSGRKLREKYGLVIGHLGILIKENGEPWMVHAASSGLSGFYEGGTVVRVPLTEYLSRVEKFAGIVVTRFQQD